VTFEPGFSQTAVATAPLPLAVAFELHALSEIAWAISAPLFPFETAEPPDALQPASAAALLAPVALALHAASASESANAPLLTLVVAVPPFSERAIELNVPGLSVMVAVALEPVSATALAWLPVPDDFVIAEELLFENDSDKLPDFAVALALEEASASASAPPLSLALAFELEPWSAVA
jgi:hypothetical protein